MEHVHEAHTVLFHVLVENRDGIEPLQPQCVRHLTLLHLLQTVERAVSNGHDPLLA